MTFRISKIATPTSLDEACRLLGESGSRLISGGTDVIPQLRASRFDADKLVDLTRLQWLDRVAGSPPFVEIGALVTHTTLERHPLLRSDAACLAQAASVVGSRQTRNRGTIAGNIANASPAGDTLPPLLALEASISIFGELGVRSVPLDEVILGPGRTSLAPTDIITHVRFVRPVPTSRSIFVRLGSRQGMAVSIASAAVMIAYDSKGMVNDVRVAIGAVAPTAIRCPRTEALLVGRRLSREAIDEAGHTAATECSPINDVRGTARYRRDAVSHLVKRSLRSLFDINGEDRQ